MLRQTPTEGQVEAGSTTPRRLYERWISGARARGLGIALAAAVFGLAVGCTHVGEFVWVDGYKEPLQEPRSGYVISRGDVIFVRVWNQDSLSGRARVRADGMISLQFVNDVEAAGLEPTVLAQRLQVKLKEFIVNPVVAVSVEETAPLQVSVMGEVTTPGVYEIERHAGVLSAIASAGGLTQLAGRDRIFVLRGGGRPEDSNRTVRIRFTYQALAHAEGNAGKFRLRAGDVVVVE
jgi:polysaccharide export outer membrane protein